MLCSNLPHRTLATVFGAFCLAILLQACGSNRMATPLESDPLLSEALARWDRCVMRSIATTDALSTRGFSSRCEGHRRDIAARYPAHLESRVTARLEERERRQLMLRSGIDVEVLSATDAFPPVIGASATAVTKQILR